MTDYRVALWRSPVSAWYEIEIPVQAENALAAATAALSQHNAGPMGVVIVMSAEKQETFNNARLVNGDMVYDRFSENPRFAGLPPFDYLKPSGSLARSIRNTRAIVEGLPDWVREEY
jgi:hypothetical protein